LIGEARKSLLTFFGFHLVTAVSPYRFANCAKRPLSNISLTLVVERLSKPVVAGCINGVRSAASFEVAAGVSRILLVGEFMIARVACS
jgi:hypothetical protein